MRAVRSIGLWVLVLLMVPGRVCAQDNVSLLRRASADNGWSAPSDTASSMRSLPVYRLLADASVDREPWLAFADPGTDTPLRLGLPPRQSPATPLTSGDSLSLQTTAPSPWMQPCLIPRLLSADSTECRPRMAAADVTTDGPPPADQSQIEVPRWTFLEQHRTLFSTLVPVTSVGGVLANSLLGYDEHGWRIHREGWFGADTSNGGADKASHLVDYFVVANLFTDVYRMLGWSENASILWGFGITVATGLANELGDGFTRHGCSFEDFAMDAAGATAATVISFTHTRDLLGMRTSHLPGSTYTHDVYSADLKLSGVAQRLGINIGPLRWLVFSITYGAKGYRVQPPPELQRQVGFEIGLNVQQILSDLGVKRDTWWGYALHLVGDNVRFPYTAFGMRYDMNHGNWHGPNSGNYD